jgi:hypothetical protein
MSLIFSKLKFTFIYISEFLHFMFVYWFDELDTQVLTFYSHEAITVLELNVDTLAEQIREQFCVMYVDKYITLWYR